MKIKDTALLVIDMINSCADEACEMKRFNISYKKIRDMAPKLKTFIKKFKDDGGKVVYINCTPWNKEHLPKNLVELYKDPLCRYYSNDRTGFREKFFQVTPEKDDTIFTKNNYDAFTNPNLDKFLKTNKIKYLIITGIFGDGCVHSTIQGGFSKGYNFIILKDLIETTDVKIRQDIQRLFKKYTWPVMFGPTINSEELNSYVDEYGP